MMPDVRAVVMTKAGSFISDTINYMADTIDWHCCCCCCLVFYKVGQTSAGSPAAAPAVLAGACADAILWVVASISLYKPLLSKGRERKDAIDDE